MKHLFLGMACAMSAGLAWGQNVPYTTELISQPYEPLEEYSLINLAPGGTILEEVLPIPFDMVIWGDTCTMLATANLGEMIIGYRKQTTCIAPVFSDICDVAPADSTGQDVSEIRHSLEGVAPNRIFKVEYHSGFTTRNADHSVITATQRATYQVWLHETGTIMFTTMAPTPSPICALIAADFINTRAWSATLTSSSEAPDRGGRCCRTPQNSNHDDIYRLLYSGAEGWGNTWPSEGTGYVFNPIQPTNVSTPTNLEVMTAFPNPAHDVLHVQWDGTSPVDAVWVDAQGRRRCSAPPTRTDHPRRG